MQVPERYVPAAQLVLLQVVHVPLVVAEAPARYWLAAHVGWSLQRWLLHDFSHEPAWLCVCLWLHRPVSTQQWPVVSKLARVQLVS